MKNHKYLEWLQDKNLAPGTIRSYLDTLQQFPQKLNTENIKAYFKANLSKYEATTLKVRKYALNSYVKFKKLKVEWEKIARLIPSVQKKFFDTITEKELTLLKQTKVERSPSIHARNNLLLDFLFYSGVRINELIHIKHQDWQGNQLKIHGKGNKVRYIFLPEFLIQHLDPTTSFLTKEETKLKLSIFVDYSKPEPPKPKSRKRLHPTPSEGLLPLSSTKKELN